MTSLIPDIMSKRDHPGRPDSLFTVTSAPSALSRCGSVNLGSLPVPRRHHQLQLHPAGAVPAALRPFSDLLGHRPLLPGRLPDAERVARRGHHTDAAPGRGEPSGADEADLLFPAGKKLEPEWPSTGNPVFNQVAFGLAKNDSLSSSALVSFAMLFCPVPSYCPSSGALSCPPSPDSVCLGCVLDRDLGR